ncbi:MAG: right-handed parallel beta-helix repeat-containing protein [Firmicutes bacterium]|nr:right-handed parallel beta-helix repeat-containing protein [Bacillota bacterium]
MKRMFGWALVLIILWPGAGAARGADYYVDSLRGNDCNSGLSEAKAWRSIEKVNNARLVPGDRILFKRGGVWRGNLTPQSGNEKQYITYGAYGEGAKPLLLGSIAKDRESDWIGLGNHLWATNGASPDQPELLLDKLEWKLWCQAGDNSAELVTDPDGSQKVICRRNRSQSDSNSSIQLTVTGIPLEAEKSYVLEFRAKCDKSFSLPPLVFMKKSSPSRHYLKKIINNHPKIEGDWKTFEIYFQSNATDPEAKLAFFLGGPEGIPEGAALNLAQITLREMAGELISSDVGNIIFDNGRECGIKIFPAPDLDAPNEFWYDAAKQRVVIYSERNPALCYKSIELALLKGVITVSDKKNIIIEDLALKYSGSFGVKNDNVRNIVIRNCDISYIGGSLMPYLGKIVRYGNGIQFWGDAIDCTVENCRLWEIYDVGLTNQNLGVKTHRNIFYRNNIIWNCEQSFSYWNRPERSITENIIFENNLCVNAGTTWGHEQRLYYDPKDPAPKYDPYGRHLGLYVNLAQTSNFIIRNNLFYVADETCIYQQKPWNGLNQFILDHNFYYQPQEKRLAYWGGKLYSPAQFAAYQKVTGKDGSSGFTVLPAVKGIFQPLVVRRTLNTAMVIWITMFPAASRIDYGMAQSEVRSITGLELTKTHILELTDLQPGAKYVYQITHTDAKGNIIAYPEKLDFLWGAPGSDSNVLNLDPAASD